MKNIHYDARSFYGIFSCGEVKSVFDHSNAMLFTQNLLYTELVWVDNHRLCAVLKPALALLAFFSCLGHNYYLLCVAANFLCSYDSLDRL
jgi:hypothetical protein